MKKLLFISFVIIAFAFVPRPANHISKTEIDFFKGSWGDAIAKAKRENKPIFLDIYATWCGPCKMLKEKTFTNREVIQFYNSHFINVSLNGEKGDGVVLAQKYQIPGYPSLLILDSDERPLYATAGYMPPEDLMKFGKEGLKKLGK
jgi:uncharacterized protein YyaL (SSP411 family)